MSILVVRPEEGARRVAIGFIEDAESAAGRVRAGDDPEALHDLRVALRRLRSTLRAYPSAVRGAISKKRRGSLRELVGFTGAGRDAEVQVAWIDEVMPSLGPAERPGGQAWRVSLEGTKGAVYDGLRAEKLGALEALLARLRADLAEYDVHYFVHADDGSRPRFGDLVAEAAARHLTELVDTLRGVRTLEDEARAHEARIFGKRLRYVLEPVRESVSETKATLDQLKQLQELLGEFQDLSVRTGALAAAMEGAALARARTAVGLVVAVPVPAVPPSRRARRPEAAPESHGDIEPGLLALLQIAQARKRSLLEELVTRWVDGPELPHLEAAVGTLVRAVVQKTRGEAPREIERKYLLRGLPPFVRGKPYARLAQGYVPGEAIIERVRRKSDRSGTKFFRTVKLGRGIERIEIEERISRSLFGALYALTEGKRVEKRRYTLEDAGYTWEIDVFTDRELVLCEVELASPTETPEPPAWLAPYVEREVTEESEFVNFNLAK